MDTTLPSPLTRACRRQGRGDMPQGRGDKYTPSPLTGEGRVGVTVNMDLERR